MNSGYKKVNTSEVKNHFDHGSTSVGTSAVQITTTSIPTKMGVLVKADSANTGTIYVGNSDVTANTTAATDGFQLGAGESLEVEIDNADKVYFIATVASQKVFWITV